MSRKITVILAVCAVIAASVAASGCARKRAKPMSVAPVPIEVAATSRYTIPETVQPTTKSVVIKATAAAATEETFEETKAPTATPKPTAKPTKKPTATPKPTAKPTKKPTATPKPTAKPTKKPTNKPTATPKATAKVTNKPTTIPEPAVKAEVKPVEESKETKPSEEPAVKVASQKTPAEAPKPEQKTPEESPEETAKKISGYYYGDNVLMYVEAANPKKTKVTVTFRSEDGSSVVEWSMSGRYRSKNETLSYRNCIKKETVYNSDGEVVSQNEIYSKGKGKLVIRDNKLNWKDYKEHFADKMTFQSEKMFKKSA